jgi:hypothetical protein
MSTNQSRAFGAATNVLAYAQAFTTASLRDEDGAVPVRRSARRGPSLLRVRRHRAGR